MKWHQEHGRGVKHWVAEGTAMCASIGKMRRQSGSYFDRS